jgi:hypothetical protein
LAAALVGAFYTPLDAELARGVLEAAGIASHIEGDALAGAAQWAQGAANVRLLVADEDAEVAERLIREHEQALTAERRKDDTLDQKALRAYRLGVIGWFLLPVITQALSAYQLARLPYSKLSEPVRRRYRIAMMVNVLVVGTVAFAIVRALVT